MDGDELLEKLKRADTDKQVLVFNGTEDDGTPIWSPLQEVLIIDGQLHLAPEGWDW